ncbi:MAG: heavy-metal-associated domain-containing protein [Lacibacter sp.]
MKLRLFFVLSLLPVWGMLQAQAGFPKPEVVQIQTPQAQCEECKQKIERFLKYEEGVSKVVVDIRKKTTMVTFLKDRTNVENIKTAIANLGFDADDVTANEEQYKRLPQCCKREADGGGPPRKKQ